MINSHLMMWNTYQEATAAQVQSQLEDFYAMGGIPEVLGLVMGRRIAVHGSGPPGRKQSNPYRPRSLENFEWIRPAYDYFFAIEFPSPAAEAEGRYGPHRAHRDFAFRHCRTIWSEYLHQDFLTETISPGRRLPEKRIYHFDFWNLWSDAPASKVEEMYRALASMPDRCQDILRIRFGRRDPTRTANGVQVGVREELGLRTAIPWHFKPTVGQFDGYFQMEFADDSAFRRYLDGPVRIEFAREFVAPLWSEYHTQRFERVSGSP